ncbi:prominin-like protein [Drosophila mojavensis]|uniref:prominin-like protein n=1 Tax=Drosophila mojavensis TaxID=7230 RepID=UPI001CD0CEB8|nr:prominin-like protein [Drosophila mojavensis]
MKSQRCFLSIRCIWAVRVIIIGCLLGSLTSSAVAQEDEDEDSNIKEDYKEDLSTELPEPKPVNKHASAVRHFGVPKYRGEFISSKDSYKVDEWRPGFEGLGTIHEQMGENHWPKPIFTKYESTVTYQGQIIYPKMGMTPIYNFTHYLFQSTLSDPPYLPDGYVVTSSRDTLILGQKTEMNDWRDLLWRYFQYLVWVAFLLLLIIIIPFIGVCYCCFCCCRRCPKGCPPCTRSRETRLRYIYGTLLFLLIVLLVLSTVVVFLTNKMIDRGMREPSQAMRRSAEDTCKYLEDIRSHIFHLFGNNYEELMNQLIYLLTHAHHHIFLDLSDSSDATGLEELDRIFKNMRHARALMKEVNAMEKEMRYLISQLRDGIRGVKREVTYACHISSHPRCLNFLQRSTIEFIDAASCLHIDQLPDSNIYLDGFKNIIDEDYNRISKNALLRLQAVKNAVDEHMKRAAPPIILSLKRGRDSLLYKAIEIRTKIDTVVNNLYFSSLGASRSFEGFYNRYAKNRSAINLIVFILLMLISITLIIGLICGCFASKAAGAVILLFALIFIFCVLSFILLVGLFYFIIGLLTYGGACEPSGYLRSHETFLNVDRKLRLFQMYHDSEDISTRQALIALQSCSPNHTVFNVLQDNSIYDVTELTKIEIFSEDDLLIPSSHEDFSNLRLLTVDELQKLTQLLNGNLSSYRSQLYTQYLCRGLTPRALPSYAQELRSIVKDLYFGYYAGHWNIRVALNNAAISLDVYHNEFVVPILNLQRSMRDKLKKIDKMILYNNNNFGYSIKTLLRMAIDAEAFIQSKGKYFIYELAKNLSIFCSEETQQFISMIERKCENEVGRCEPLSNIYHRSVDLICENLVDPINGFWVGVLSAALILLPLLFILHRLICLYKIYTPPPAATFVGHCPACMARAPGGYNTRIAISDNMQDYKDPPFAATKQKKKD